MWPLLTAALLVLCVGVVVAQECVDDPEFLDEMDHSCDFWAMVGWECDRAEEDHWYTPAAEEALLVACAATCGTCDIAVDCVGEWSTCSEDCADKVFEVTRHARADGAQCEERDGATAPCSPGEGNCPTLPPPAPAPAPVDCEGAWSVCGADCNDKTFLVTTEAAGRGTPNA